MRVRQHIRIVLLSRQAKFRAWYQFHRGRMVGQLCVMKFFLQNNIICIDCLPSFSSFSTFLFCICHHFLECKDVI